MKKSFYLLTRDLHLYTGLFISPLVVVFAISVFVLVHPPGEAPPNSVARLSRQVENLHVPTGIESLSGRARVDAVRSLLDQAHIRGEIGFISYSPKDYELSIPVTVPGRETTLDLDLSTRTATVTERRTGIGDAFLLLHKSPGPHLADIRMNWSPMIIWRLLADGTCYLLFFISISGIYLWFMLRSERRVGIALLVAGAVSFFGMVYAIAG